MSLTAQRLRELLAYSPETGLFKRLVYRSANAPAGSAAGHTDERGYVFITVDLKQYRAHRLAWLYVHGAWPIAEIDHINGDKADNRITNLRDVPRAINAQNQRRPRAGSLTGALGVTRCRRSNLWCAAITVRGTHKTIGRYATRELAHAAYVEAKRQLHVGGTL